MFFWAFSVFSLGSRFCWFPDLDVFFVVKSVLMEFKDCSNMLKQNMCDFLACLNVFLGFSKVSSKLGSFKEKVTCLQFSWVFQRMFKVVPKVF